MTSKGRRVWWVAAFLTLVLALALTPTVAGESSSQARAQIGQAYAVVLGAEQSGGNATELVAKLDTAISLIQRADQINATDPVLAQTLYGNASSLAAQIIQSAPAVASAGKAAVFASQVNLTIETALLAVLAVAAYLHAPRVFWRLWLRAHRDWRVKKS